MKMGDNNVIESKGKLCLEFYCQCNRLLSLCCVQGNNLSPSKVACLDWTRVIVIASKEPNLVMWLSENAANSIKLKSQLCTVKLGLD